MGGRCASNRQTPDRRLLVHAERLWSHVNVSDLFDRLQSVYRRQHTPVIREAEVEQFRVHGPSSSSFRSRCHREYRAAKDICPSSEGRFLYVIVVYEISVFCELSNVGVYSVPR